MEQMAFPGIVVQTNVIPGRVQMTRPTRGDTRREVDLISNDKRTFSRCIRDFRKELSMSLQLERWRL